MVSPIISFHLLDADLRTANPLVPKPVDFLVTNWDQYLSKRFPKFFGPEADHHCEYRKHLFFVLAADLRLSSLKKVEGVVILSSFAPLLKLIFFQHSLLPRIQRHPLAVRSCVHPSPRTALQALLSNAVGSAMPPVRFLRSEFLSRLRQRRIQRHPQGRV